MNKDFEDLNSELSWSATKLHEIQKHPKQFKEDLLKAQSVFGIHSEIVNFDFSILLNNTHSKIDQLSAKLLKNSKPAAQQAKSIQNLNIAFQNLEREILGKTLPRIKEKVPRNDIDFKRKISDEIINNHHAKKQGIRDKDYFKKIEKEFEQEIFNFDYEKEDDRLSIHMPKSIVEMPKNSIKSVSIKTQQDDEILLSRALANQTSQNIDLAYLQTLSSKFLMRPARISRLQIYKKSLVQLAYYQKMLSQKSEAVRKYANSIFISEIEKLNNEKDQHRIIECQFFVDIWLSVETLADKNIEIEIYEESENPELADVLCKSMERKIRVDMEFDGNISKQEIFEETKKFVYCEIKERPKLIKKSDVYYIEGLQFYPYAVIFVLFMTGLHDIALGYLNHCTPAFSSMYQDYVNLYHCTYIPASKISHYHSLVMNEPLCDLHLVDQYRSLLFNLMIGCLHKDDKTFRDSILFGSIDIQTWLYLKAASCYQSEEEYPNWYKGYNMQQYKKRVDTIYTYASQNGERLEAMKTLFFSGQFTKFVNELQINGYVADSVFLMIGLLNLGLIETKYDIVKHLSHLDNILSLMSSCLDVQALLHCFLHSESLSMTEAVSLMLQMEDQDIANASIAQYFMKNDILFQQKLQFQQEEEIRTFLGEERFKQIVSKVVEFNEIGPRYSKGDKIITNIKLLEMIEEKQKAVQMMEKLQIYYIEESKPKDLLKPILEVELLRSVVQGQFLSKPISLVTEKIPAIIDRFKRENHIHSSMLFLLEKAAAALDHFQRGQILQALEIFSKESFQILFSSEIKEDLIVAYAKCLYCNVTQSQAQNIRSDFSSQKEQLKALSTHNFAQKLIRKIQSLIFI